MRKSIVRFSKAAISSAAKAHSLLGEEAAHQILVGAVAVLLL
jgi:hypothetical protein